MAGEGRDPDYRFTLANERTFLAWVRTALGLLAGAVAVVHLVPDLGIAGAQRVVGGALAILSIMVCLAGLRRWRMVQAAMRRGGDLPYSRVPVIVGLSLAAVSLVVLVLLVAFGRA